MISDWLTNKIYLSGKLTINFPKTSKEIESKLKHFNYIPEFLPNTNDIWARDFMPIQISDNKFIEYRYDPDYLQGNSDNDETRELKTYPDVVCNSIGLKTTKSDIILDGGNIVKSENTIILTDKVVWENQRNYSKKQLIQKLHKLFEVDNIVLIPWDEECIYGHSDGMLRFINSSTVLISGFYETVDNKFKLQILESLKKGKLDWEWLKCSEKEVEDNIAYISFLQTKDLILIPTLNRTEDKVALEQISKHYPVYATNERIDQIGMTEIVRFGGSLNCIIWTKKE